VLRNILHTIGARYLVAFLNLLLIFINSKVLGREGMGMVGIIYASANLAVIFNSILCGNTIVYFMNRYNLRYVFFPAYGWAVAGSGIACGVMWLLGMLPAGYEGAVFGLAALSSLVTSHSLMLLGKDRVKGFNLTFVVQGVSMFLLLLLFYFVLHYRGVGGYLTGLFAANVAAYLFSGFLLVPLLGRGRNGAVGRSFGAVLKEMFVYGVWGAVDNLAEGLTTRLNYFFVQHTGGYGAVGLLDSGTKMAESVWHISNSVSFMEYNQVSKTTDLQEQKRVTLSLFKLTGCLLTLVMAIVVCIPEWVYTEYLLTLEFAGIRQVIVGLSVGIVAFGANRILSHFFIGSGCIQYSAFCSLCGLALLSAGGFWLIPEQGVFGAAVACSIAYTGMLLFSLCVFMKRTGTRCGELIPSQKDWGVLRDKWRRRAG
jgi:O-antigen/teichoic acid export membrane protein